MMKELRMVLTSLVALSFTTVMMLMVLNKETKTVELQCSIEARRDARVGTICHCPALPVIRQDPDAAGVAAATAAMARTASGKQGPSGSANRDNAGFNVVNVCQPTSNQNLIIIWVDSAPANFDRRDKIRSTWGSVRSDNLTDVRTLFFIGGVESSTLQNAISAEAATHGDVVQDTSYLDTYRNLTRKGLSALRWMASHCPELLSSVKVDDDTLVNPYNLVSFIRSASPGTLDKFICRMTVSKPIRDAANKYFVSLGEFKGIAYPLYCQGYGYMVPPRAIHGLLKAARNVSLLSMEDVYITGLLSRFIGLRHYPLSPAFTTTSVDSAQDFQQKIAKNKNLIFVGHSRTLYQYDTFWKLINDMRG